MAGSYAALYVVINPQSYLDDFGDSFNQQILAVLAVTRGLIIWFLPWVLLSGITRYTFLPPSFPVWRLKNMLLLGAGIGALVTFGYLAWLAPFYYYYHAPWVTPISLMGVALALAFGSIMGAATGCLVGLAARWFKRGR